MSMYDGIGANIYGNRLMGQTQPNGMPYGGYDPSVNSLMPMTQMTPQNMPMSSGLPSGVVPYQQTQPTQSAGYAPMGSLAAIAGNAGQPLQFPVQTRTIYAPPVVVQALPPPPPPPAPVAPPVTYDSNDHMEGAGNGGYKDGGEVTAPDYDYRSGSRMVHSLPEGMVKGDGGGQDDSHCAFVPRGAFIVPAGVVASLGGGNSMAGAAALAKAMPQADDRDKPEMIPIKISSGEFVIHPAHVAAIGGGSADAGVERLKQMMAKHL